MGWTGMHRDRGTTNEDFFATELGRDDWTIHASGTVDGVFYAAVERPKNPGEIFAFVALIRWSPNEWHNFTFKEMSENSGPYDAKAPVKVLKALTPTDSEYATEWRKRCWVHHERRKMLRGLQDGDTVNFGYTVRFTDGTECEDLTVRRERVRGGRTQVRLVTPEGVAVRFPGWRDRVVSMVRGGESATLPVVAPV